MMCLLESHTRLSSSIWWPKLRVARISDYSLSNISVAFVHARTDEGIFVKKLSGIKSSRFGRLKAAVNGTRKASKPWQEFSCDKLVTKKLFPTEGHQSVHLQTVLQHGDDFLVCVISIQFGSVG